MISRADFIDIAVSYLGTPYRIGGQVKGAGVDCCSLIYCCMKEAGMIGAENIGIFHGDWWAHATEDVYLKRIRRHAFKIAESTCTRSIEAEPGNIVLCKTAGSKVYNHGAIITKWPMGIEAIPPTVELVNLSMSSLWTFKQIVIFDPFRKEE